MKGPKPKLFSFQDQLPRLPVPPLTASCRRYLESLRPLASEAEYAFSERCVQEFVRQGGNGEQLQLQLEAYSDAEWAEGRNWLERWWLQFAYLMWPDPLPLHSNVFFLFVTAPSGEHIFQAARLATAFLSAKGKIEREEMPVDFTGSLPMDMSQHRMAFTTARIPGEKGDTLMRHEAEGHMLVLCNHRMFQVNLLDDAGDQVCSQVIESQLRNVWTLAHQGARQHHGLGLMTSEERPTWARWRAQLERNPQNAEILRVVDRAALVLTLEDEEPAGTDEALRALAGGDASNRWFDKGFTVVVFRNGLAGMNAEHSPAEATMHDAVFGQTVFARLRSLGPWAYPDSQTIPVGGVPTVAELVLQEPPSGLQEALAAAHARYETDFADLEVRALQFLDWGSDWAKAQGLPIDSVIQMALQLAWGRLHGAPVSCYETSHLRLFKGGRTETCRSTSTDSKAWVDAVLRGATPVEIKALFRVALESQKTYMLDCIKARGCDRHLLGLRILAMQSGQPMPALFTDPLFARSSSWRLSTSTVRTTEIGGFPPVAADGYGVCYMFWRSGTAIVASITARKACGMTSATQFRDEVVRSLRLIRENWETATEAAL